MLCLRQIGTPCWGTLFSKLEEPKICAVPSGLGCLPHPPTRHFRAGLSYTAASRLEFPTRHLKSDVCGLRSEVRPQCTIS